MIGVPEGTDLQESYRDMLARLGSMAASVMPGRAAGGAARLYSRTAEPAVNEKVLHNLLGQNPDVRLGHDVLEPPGSAYYDPAEKYVRVGGSLDKLPHRKVRLGVLAHEFGHARQKLLHKYPQMVRLMSEVPFHGRLFSSMATGLTSNENVGLASGVAGSLAGLPQVANEAHASLVGSKELAKAFREAGRRVPLRARLSPFVGVPSYVLGSGAPLIRHYLMKLLGQYKKKTS